MAVIKVRDSYKVWTRETMKNRMIACAFVHHNVTNPEKLLNRTYRSMFIEWYLHNIGYYVTLPFTRIEALRKINLRCKDVDLEEWK
jgi:hypothetical protein